MERRNKRLTMCRLEYSVKWIWDSLCSRRMGSMFITELFNLDHDDLRLYLGEDFGFGQKKYNVAVTVGDGAVKFLDWQFDEFGNDRNKWLFSKIINNALRVISSDVESDDLSIYDLIGVIKRYLKERKNGGCDGGIF